MKKIIYTIIVFLFPLVTLAHGGTEVGDGYNSMYGGGGMLGGSLSFFGIAGHIILLIIGILVILWLWKKITNDRK